MVFWILLGAGSRLAGRSLRSEREPLLSSPDDSLLPECRPPQLRQPRPPYIPKPPMRGINRPNWAWAGSGRLNVLIARKAMPEHAAMRLGRYLFMSCLQ